MKRAAEYVTPGTLDDAAARWLADVRGQTRPRPKLRLDARRCCLLCIDLVNYFVHEGGRAFLPASAAVVPRVAGLVDAFRAKGAPVAFTRHAHEGPADLGMLGRFYSDYIRDGEDESRLAEAFAPRADEPVFKKRTYDAFTGTGLDEWLRLRGCDQVLVTGVLTHLCCETTARAAFVRGFEVYLAADATATTTERLHLGSLLALADGFAVVLSAKEATACLG